MSYEISLIKVLDNKDKLLHGRLAQLRTKAISLLSYTQGKFPYYTPHDFSHSLNVEENLNWLVPDQLKEQMNIYELFFIIVAAWLHDWGMIGKEDEDPEDIRKEHHIRTEAYFEKMHDILDLNEHEARIIGRISKGHRKVDLNSHEYDDILFSQNNKVRIRFLASLLRIADECDIAHNRTPEIIYCSINPKGKSEEEFKKHLSIGGIGQLEERHKIYISAIARDPKGARTLREVERKIQNELNSVKGVLAQNGIILDLVELRLETRGFIDKPIGFEVDKTKIVSLLIGEHLYSKQDAAIRELVQNSIDSCKLKESIDSSFHGRVFLKKDCDGNLVIEDNGLGMSYIEAKQFLSRIGSSFYKSALYQEQFGEKKYKPISQFGIGILSSFLICDKISIETLSEGEDACKFSIESVNEDWRYEKGSLGEPGTRITLKLNDVGKDISIDNSLKKYFLCPEILIEYTDCNVDLKTFEAEWSHKLIYQRFLQEINDDTDEYFTEMLNESREDYDYVVEKCSDWHSKQLVLFIHGIYVGNFTINGLYTKCRVCVNLKNNIIDLHISRENIIENKKWSDFIKLLFDDIFISIKKKHKDDDCNKIVSLFSYMIDRYVEVEKNDYLTDSAPFLSSFLDNSQILFMSSGSVSIVDLKDMFNYDNITIYNSCNSTCDEELKLLSNAYSGKELFIYPFSTAIIIEDNNLRISNEFINFVLDKKNITYEEIDLREILISSATVIDIDYPEILPDNVRLATFGKNINPLVVVFENATVEKHDAALGIAYWANILLWKRLVDKGRQSTYLDPIREFSDDRFDRIKIIDEPIVYVDVSDNFINSVLEKRKEGPFDDHISKNIQRYFKYLSFFPLALSDTSSCLIFLEVLEKIEEDISISLGIKQPSPLFERMKPNSSVFLEYYNKFGLVYSEIEK